jgi:squalene-hopene/tetraprenyl-beta-curcumene cyclase
MSASAPLSLLRPISSLALFLLALLPAQANKQAPTPQELDLKEAIDPSIRWMRSQQNRETGSYGDLETTIWVLHAMASSPRKYRRTDGSFVRDGVRWLIEQQAEDGAYGAKSVPSDQRLKNTSLATVTLYHFLDETTQAGYAKALMFLASHGVDDPHGVLPAYKQDKEKARKRAVRLLAAREADFSWQGSLKLTAQNVAELSAYATLLKPAASPGRNARALPRWSPKDAERTDQAIARGAAYLLSQQVEPGRWGSPRGADAGISAMVLGALAAVPEPRPKDVQESLATGLKWLASLQHEDGSIHQGQLANYVTSASIMALSRSNDPQFTQVIAKARSYIVQLQADEGEGYSAGDRYYGGIGYGGDERPDLSNLQMALDALSASGLKQDHEAYARAIKFLERCQNRSESNDIQILEEGVIIQSGEDGGAGYAPGSSKAEYEITTRDGKRVKVPRSYGSMTYALFKCYLLAGLDRQDPRVQAAWHWLGQNWTLDQNPGFEASRDPSAAYQGLFYYYQGMARALALSGSEEITDAEGVVHAWRTELSARIVTLQNRIDGSWVNQNAPRWWEGNPVLATSYALSTLDACRVR